MISALILPTQPLAPPLRPQTCGTTASPASLPANPAHGRRHAGCTGSSQRLSTTRPPRPSPRGLGVVSARQYTPCASRAPPSSASHPCPWLPMRPCLPMLGSTRTREMALRLSTLCMPGISAWQRFKLRMHSSIRVTHTRASCLAVLPVLLRMVLSSSAHYSLYHHRHHTWHSPAQSFLPPHRPAWSTHYQIQLQHDLLPLLSCTSQGRQSLQ